MTAADKRQNVKLPLGLIPTDRGEFPFLLALDPGGTTGWARYNPITGEVECGHLGPEEHHLELYNLLIATSVIAGLSNRKLVIICESFEFRNSVNKDKIELFSREYIGVAKLFVQCNYGVMLVFQTASSGKFFIHDVKLKRMGWYIPTRGMTHARDALRHLSRYMVTTLRVKEPIVDKWFNKENN